MAKTIAEWISEGDEIYQNALNEYHRLEEQLRELSAQWRAKQAQINRVAAFLGKEPLDASPAEEPAPAAPVPMASFPTAPVPAGAPADLINGPRLNIATGRAVRR